MRASGPTPTCVKTRRPSASMASIARKRSLRRAVSAASARPPWRPSSRARMLAVPPGMMPRLTSWVWGPARAIASATMPTVPSPPAATIRSQPRVTASRTTRRVASRAPEPDGVSRKEHWRPCSRQTVSHASRMSSAGYRDAPGFRMTSRSVTLTRSLEAERGFGARAKEGPAPRSARRREKVEQSALASLERAWTAVHQRVHSFDLVGNHAPALEAVDDLGEHIRGATDRGRVAEMLRDLAHRRSDATLGLRTRGRLAPPLARERAGAEQGPGPGAELLRAEPLSHHVLDVGVDVLPSHVDHGARVTLELEHLARMAEERAHERREAP